MRTIFFLTGYLSLLAASYGQFAEDVLRFSTYNEIVGARSLGIGGAGIGYADDYSSLFVNPANLASLRTHEFSAGLSNLQYSNKATLFANETPSDLASTTLNNLGVVYAVPTVRGSLTFAIGYARVANYTTKALFSGFNAQNSIVPSLAPVTNIGSMSAASRAEFLDSNIPFQIYLADTSAGALFPVVTDSVLQAADVIEGGGLNAWSAGGAVDIAQNLSVGMAINFITGTYTYERTYEESDSKDVYRYAPPYDFDFFRFQNTISSDISGYNVLFGLTFREKGLYRLGMTVRTPTMLDIKEEFTDKGESRFDNGDMYDIEFAGTTEYSVQGPFTFGAGGMLQPTEWLGVALDAEYTDWREMKFTTSAPHLISENRYIRNAFRPTTSLRGGVEITFWDAGIAVRAGASYQPSPYKNDPSDFDKLMYTGGISVRADDFTMITLGGSYGAWKTIRDNYYLSGATNPSRTSESISSGSVILTLAYRF